ncbi:MAG: malate dehydrogenase [Bacteroides sp.]|nr:malate dehydrogenase [Bacteroides sp.]MDE7190655.1 malate dehydrogenase [Muribaculaceae bacterium]
MSKSLEEAALDYHRYPQPGKIEVVPTKPYDTPEDLALAYSPGVAYPCLAIKDDANKIFDYTNRGNLVAVISNGTAVLGLGNIGAKASKPVMEGKVLLFKIFAGLDAFDIEIDETDPKEFVRTVARLAPTFGGINLEDIKAPECFEIEKDLREELDIPVMHDDQHGTAIISSAALLNALLLQHKDIDKVKVVVNGAGAAAIACTRLFCELGVRHENIVMCDSKGVIRKDRGNLNPTKAEFATDRDINTLAEAMKGADVFLGLSVADVVTEEMLMSMAKRPIVFALANPAPEIAYEVAIASRSDIIFATGRSDYPNQINNVLGFPYIFRGALDCGATEINEAMKVAAARAIAALAQEPVPDDIAKAYGVEHLSFGPSYILPKPFDHRLLTVVAPAVIKAAEESGIARKKIEDFDTYRNRLQEIICTNEALIAYLIKTQSACRM